MARHFQHLVLQMAFRPQPVFNSVRLYSRWMHRKPARVLLPFEPNSKVNLKKEEIIDLEPHMKAKSKEKIDKKLNKPKITVQNQISTTSNTQQVDEINDKKAVSSSSEKPIKTKTKREETLQKRKFYLSQKKVFNDTGEIIYEKLKESDARFSSFLVKLKSKKERQHSGFTLVEGWRLIVDGLEAKCSLKYVIFSKIEDLNNLRPFLPRTGVQFYKMAYKEMQLWSDVETSPGIFGVFETPTPENIRRLNKSLPLHLLCDNIRVPGNLGAILRAAVGAGCDKVLLTKGCVDLWDPKVIISAAGAHFRLPIHHSIDWSDMPSLISEGTSVFIADSNAKVQRTEEPSIEELENMNMPVLPYYGVDYASLKHITLIIGGETEGISEESYEFAANHKGLRINIPLQTGVDSLNTGMAAAVIAFEIRKQLIQAWTKMKMDRQMGLTT